MTVDKEKVKELTLWEHLEELRSRLLKIVVAVIIMFGVGYYFRIPLFKI